MKKIIISVFVLSFVLAGCKVPIAIKTDSADKSKLEVENLINEYLMKGQKAVVKEISEESGMFKIKVDLGNGQNADAFVTKDLKKFIPQVIDFEKLKIKKEEESVPLPTAAKPVVELFVMSHCPFGTQIEKGMLPVLDTLGDKIDFQLKFVNYVMHGEKEINEELLQFCVRKEEPTKLNDYLKCFLADETGSKKCLTENEIDSEKIESCVATTDEEFSISKNFADKTTYKGNYPTFNIHNTENEKYGVAGSPTLVINGKKSNSGRDSKSLLAAVCGGFETPPTECTTELSAASPAPGFGFGEVSAGGADASCGE
jgi:hypothetical protein